MDQIIEFASKHYLLFIALFITIFLIVVNELKRLGASGANVSSKEAVLLFNKSNAVFIDIRSISEFDGEHIPEAINIPHTTVAEKITTLLKYKDKPVILYCLNGTTTSKVSKLLKENNFSNVLNLKGGINAWKEEKLPINSK